MTSNFVIRLLYLALDMGFVLVGTLLIYNAVKDFKNASYFAFGFDIMMAIFNAAWMVWSILGR